MKKLLILTLIFALAFSCTAYAAVENFAVTKGGTDEYEITFNLPTDAEGVQVFVYGPVKGAYDTKVSMDPTGEWKDYYVHYTRYFEATDSTVNAGFTVKLPANVLVDTLYVTAVTSEGEVNHIVSDDVKKMPGVSSLKSLEITDSNGETVADTITVSVPSSQTFKTKITDEYGNLMTDAKVNFTTENLTAAAIQLIDSTIVVDDKSANNGVSFKLTASYNNLSDIVTINVVGSGSGSGSTSGGGSSKNNSSGKGSGVSVSPSVIGSNASADKPFTDLSEDAWYYDNLMNLYSLGILYGSNGQANPTGEITVQEICAFLQRAMKLEADSDIVSQLADDATVSDWAREPVSAAVKAGVLNGDGSSYNGLSNATREQAFVLLARAFGLQDGDAELNFADADAVSDWAKKSISAMVDNGYVNGDNEGNIAPKNAITRAEFCAVLDRILSK